MLLFGIVHSIVLLRSFYIIWIPSNKLAALASHFHLNSKQLLWIIIVIAFPCMVCSLFLCLAYLLNHYQQDDRRIAGFEIILFFALMTYQSSQGISCGIVRNHVLCGTLIITALIALVNLIAANVKISVLVGTFPFLLFSTINYYVYQFRGRELGPFDIGSFGTAMNVVSEYKFSFSLFVVLGWLGWLLLMTALFLSKRDVVYHKKENRIVSGMICLLSILLVFVIAKDTPVRSWTNQGSSINGTVLNFFLQIRDSRIQTPENYSLESLQQLEQKYQTDESIPNESYPSIIVIMNESFTDFSVLGNNVQTEVPLLPFLSSMEENTVRGYVYSSVYGGNTANSEFEFLTGDSMAFLPSGSVPYQQYLSDSQYSLLSFLHSSGYYCIATHPYIANGWNRTNVYDWFGFDEMSFVDDYPHNDIVRKYISDREMFDYVISEYEERDISKNFFLFGITIQNHGGYRFTNFESTVPLEYTSQYPEAEQFLSLANLSDQAVEYLIEYFSEVTDPVVICFFGDHQPKVEDGFLEAVHGGSFDDLDSEMLKYKVPFFIWANYDIEEQQNIETSINYLSNYLLEACGFDLPAYNQFLLDAQQSVPILTALGYYSTSSGRFLPVSEAVGEEKETLNQYYILEYNNLFDKENESLIFKN